MFTTKSVRLLALALLFSLNGFAIASAQSRPPLTDLTIQDSAQTLAEGLPSPLCDSLQVPQGNQLMARVFAVGTQNYRWNGTAWVFIEPVATLYADASYQVKLGIHYVGPTWEGNIGGKVTAARVASCTPDVTAIPWLLLQTTSTNDPGIFTAVTYIQRVNTKGGLAPTAPGVSVGAIAEVPYSTEYYFYRSQN